MATDTLIHYASTLKQICFRDSTDFSPTAANDLRLTINGNSPLLVQWDGTSLADGSARQSTKFDFGDGTELWAPQYSVRAAMEWASSPTAQRSLKFFLAPSSSATAGTGNPGGVSGSDSAYSGYSGGSLGDSLVHLQPIGTFACEGVGSSVIEICECGIFTPRMRYGSLVVVNDSAQSLAADAVEMHIVLTPLVAEFQNT